MGPLLLDIIEECGAITIAGGFDPSQHRTQIALIATEVGEALECLAPAFADSFEEQVVAHYCQNLMTSSAELENHRKHAHAHTDRSRITDLSALYEELADVVIRVFSYAGGNGHAQTLADNIVAKMAKNKSRPHRHGKAF